MEGEATNVSIDIEDISSDSETGYDTQGVQKFSPIDARHLSSLPLVKGRIIRLLKRSKNQMHAAQNLLVTIVGSPFQSTISASLMVLGILEPNQNG
jgi:oxalate---CoA ligase